MLKLAEKLPGCDDKAHLLNAVRYRAFNPAPPRLSASSGERGLGEHLRTFR
jgi:hypothetical protein